MDADERLMALKKAYADIILNTAKEAAGRIMTSERKALRFQHELGVAKEQGLQMLLRLKLMMDSKVSEAGMMYLSQQKTIKELKAQLQEAEDKISAAEMTSLSQQRKIEELEAQLQEAEDIVKDVREELRELQAELERVRKNKLQHIDEDYTATQEQTSQENILNTSQSLTFPPPEFRLEPFTTSDVKDFAFNQRNEVYNFQSVNDSHIGTFHIGKPDFPSILEEHRLSTSKSVLSPPDSRLEPFTASDINSSASDQRNEVYKGYNANGFLMGNSHVSKPDVPSIILRSKELEPFRNRRTQRIRAFEEKLMAGELAFSDTVDDVNYETSGREDGEDEGTRKTSSRKAGNMCSTEKKDRVQADKGSKKVQKVKSFGQKRRRATRYKNKNPSSGQLSNRPMKRDQISDISTEANSLTISAQSCGDPCNVAPRMSSDTTDKNTLVGCTEFTESNAEFGKAVSVENTMNKDKALIDPLLVTKQETGSADSSGVSICRMDVGKVDVPIANSQTETSSTTNGISNQPVTNSRVIKYTFQRKRKRESLSTFDWKDSPEKSSLKIRAAEEQNGLLETEKSSSITELPRDSWHLAQVARQLISLSEKKW
ncbi:Serine/threonine-protein kinase dyrk2 [Actinidia chinensis var. chinensis]|uniref:Serine/threonine-protein kinase dyrk2 n=1 Tax=Actinidia chinensis var. chinensis TaxID=1590841 RepID=A0A2R6PUA5_ACTCC|nr:Serine/threonine-protein kinase dyrk2 [Actinidia chinensis var. chinensis]